MLYIIILTGIAGIIGTGVGGLIGCVFDKQNRSTIGAVMSVASGIMLAVVFCDLLPSAVGMVNDCSVAILGLLWGIILIIIMNLLIEKTTKKIEKIKIKILHNSIRDTEKKDLGKMGVLLVLAIALHNIPEGVAVGIGGVTAYDMGISLAIVIMLHNIPEGMSISLPFVVSGRKKSIAIILSLLAGSMTIIGGFAGYYLGGISNAISSFMLGVAGGAMLQIVFCDMLPTSSVFIKNSTIGYCVLLGVF